jgi:predicted nucleotidyltransferase
VVDHTFLQRYSAEKITIMRNLVFALRTRAAIARRFQTLIERLQPSSAERTRFARHNSTVVQRLTASLRTVKPVLMGSYTRNTAIGGYSDLDLLVPLRAAEVKWGNELKSSDTVLKTIRGELSSRFYQSDIGRDGQAIVAAFSDGTQIDVVPGFFTAFDRMPVYAIPDGASGWMNTSPIRHNKYLKDADFTSGGKLRRIAQLIKFWRFTRTPSVPLSSFHVELLLASEKTCVGVKGYSTCLSDTFALLASRQGRSLQDPVGISGWVTAASTQAKRDALATSLRDSAAHARSAHLAELNGDTEEAIRQWNIVFNGCFPRT